ncbi:MULTISPECIES: acyl carrier protein [unclassified Streptomyces]|uniref:acyl carrier protein n=1 Tax=unclassified Streptomyces TaxID=2593676 RepID=UPI0036EEB9E3
MVQEQDIIKVLEQVLNKELPDATADTRLFEDLSLDSTAALEVLMGVEESLGIAFEPESLEPEHLQTVGRLTAFVRSQK